MARARRPWASELLRVRSPRRTGSRALSQVAMPAVLSGVTVTTLGRPPHRARDGHGQHLQIHSLVSDPDDWHADHLGLDAALRAVEPPGDDRPREHPNGFKSVGVSLPGSVATWAFSGHARRGTQDHPAYIPRAVRCPVRWMAAGHVSRRTGQAVQSRLQMTAALPWFRICLRSMAAVHHGGNGSAARFRDVLGRSRGPPRLRRWKVAMPSASG
jgi:hypothetical protein